MLIIRKVLAATVVSMVMTANLASPALALGSAPTEKQSVPKAAKVVATKEKVVVKVLSERAIVRASRSHARIVMKGYGWMSTREWRCLDTLWTRESNWRAKAYNKIKVNGKHAGGIPQILGLDPKTPMPIQVKKGLDYIDSRYGSPCKALRFWDTKHWY